MPNTRLSGKTAEFMTASFTTLASQIAPLQWQAATWQDYLAYQATETLERVRLFFNGHALLVDMGAEGIEHASTSDLFTLLFFIWFNARQPYLRVSSLGRCLLEKPEFRSASPDLVLYIGDPIPQWQPGELRRINLDHWRVPDLVGEIADTTLAFDLDEKKQIYADLKIPEYWVIDVKGRRVVAFRLQPDGHYQACTESIALAGLPIALLDQTLARLAIEPNFSVANWFAQAIG
jgi:Uma2 family endonuclease